MTKAVEILNELRKAERAYKYTKEEVNEVIDQAIKAVEQQPCDDCISREMAIDVVRKWFDKIQLNSDICLDGIISLPSVTPSRSKGKWIQTKDDCDGVNFYDFSFECTECGKERSFKSNFCPNCGADMRGGRER